MTPTAPLPRDITGRIALRAGRAVDIEVTASTPPSGLVAVGVMVSSILLSVAAIIWVARRGVAQPGRPAPRSSAESARSR